MLESWNLDFLFQFIVAGHETLLPTLVEMMRTKDSDQFVSFV